MLSKAFLSGEAPQKWLPLRKKSFYESLRIEPLLSHKAVSLDPGAKQVEFENGTSLNADAILLATGGRPKTLDFKGIESIPSYTLRCIADSKAIIQAAETANTVIILGAGFIGMETAASLIARGKEVHLVAPESSPGEHVFGSRIGERLKRLHEENGVHMHMEKTVTEAAPNNDGFICTLSDGEKVPGDLLILGVGVEPVLDYLEGKGLIEDGTVPVNGYLATKQEGIFAAGDIARFPDQRSGENARIEHWVLAEQQGKHAAAAMLGKKSDFNQVPFFWTRQYGKSLKYIGYAGSADDMVFRGDVENGSFLCGYYKGGTLLAAASFGIGKDFLRLYEIVKSNKNIPLKDFGKEEKSIASYL
jgi:NADPH-dependent 2,4-dienoyl-CoA reductase/sulfur reductase-like enzyme